MDGATGCSKDEEGDTQRSRNNLSEETNKKQPKKSFIISTAKLKPGESFFALDPARGGSNRERPDVEKLLPLTQPTVKELFVCQICSRKFTTKGGRTNHLKICSK